jgi:glycine dehydrogenase subunit 1
VPAVLDRVAEDGIAAGYWLGRDYPEYEDGLVVALTERRSREDIDRLADSLDRAIVQVSGMDGLLPDSGKNPPMAEGVAS